MGACAYSPDFLGVENNYISKHQICVKFHLTYSSLSFGALGFGWLILPYICIKSWFPHHHVHLLIPCIKKSDTPLQCHLPPLTGNSRPLLAWLKDYWLFWPKYHTYFTNLDVPENAGISWDFPYETQHLRDPKISIFRGTLYLGSILGGWRMGCPGLGVFLDRFLKSPTLKLPSGKLT